MDVTFDGPLPLCVEQVGEWVPGESKSVPGELAARLVRRDDFRPTPKRRPKAAKTAETK